MIEPNRPAGAATTSAPTPVFLALALAFLAWMLLNAARDVAPQDAPASDAREAPWPAPVIDATRYRLDSEEVLFDEVDLFHHSVFLGTIHPPFSPERVRRLNANYYFRHSRAEHDPDAAGEWFGEIAALPPAATEPTTTVQTPRKHPDKRALKTTTPVRAEPERAGLMYLPRAVKLDGARALTLRLRKGAASARVYLRVYRSATEVATVEEGRLAGFPVIKDTQWHTLRIPLQSLAFDTRELPSPVIPHRKSGGKAPDNTLPLVESAPGELFAVELGFTPDKAARSIYFDRLSLLREDLPNRHVRGKVAPAVADLEIHVGTPGQAYTVKTDANGAFDLALPDDVVKIEVATRYKGVNYLPSAGRYLDVGSYLPELHINLVDTLPAPYGARPSQVYFAKRSTYGLHYEPKSYQILGGTSVQHYGMVEAQINNLGYRGSDHPLDKPAGSYRVLLTGNCHIDGRQVATDEHVCTQVEAMAAFDGKFVECMSVGTGHQPMTGHYSTIKELVPRLGIDLALLTVVAPIEFSLLDPERYGNNKNFDPAHPNADYFRVDDAGKLEHIPYDPEHMRYIANRPHWTAERMQARDELYTREMLTVDEHARDPEVQKTYRAFIGGLKMMADAAHDGGAEFGLVLNNPFFSRALAGKGFEPPPIADDLGELPDASDLPSGGTLQNQKLLPENFEQVVEDAAREVGARYLPVGTYIAEHAKTDDGQISFGWIYGAHMNPGAHRLFAESLYQSLSGVPRAAPTPPAPRREVAPLVTEVVGDGIGHDVLQPSHDRVELRVLNPQFYWRGVPDALDYEVEIRDALRPQSKTTWRTTLTTLRVPSDAALLPGQAYTVQVRARFDEKRGSKWSLPVRLQVGTPPPAFFGKLPRTTAMQFERTRAAPLERDRFYSEMLTVGEVATRTQTLRGYLARHPPSWARAYGEFVDALRADGYEFKSFADYEPGDLARKRVFLRFDVHRNDIAEAYRVMEANLARQVPATYEITWEVDPQDWAYARDYVNLRKMADPQGFVRFGMHANPLRTWLCVNRFASDCLRMFEFFRHDKLEAEIHALSRSGRSTVFGARDDIIAGADTYLDVVGARFRAQFPEATTLSSHGDLSLWRPGGEDAYQSPDASQLSVLPFLADQRRINRAGFRYNHTSTGSLPDNTFVFDVVRKNAVVPEKLAQLRAGMGDGRALFVYIHPSAMKR